MHRLLPDIGLLEEQRQPIAQRFWLGCRGAQGCQLVELPVRHGDASAFPLHQLLFSLDLLLQLALAHPLDHHPHRAGGTLRRVRHPGREQEDVSFPDVDVPGLAVLDGLDDDVALDLEEQLFAVLDVVVLPRVRTADDHHEELGVLPDHLVPHGGLQEMTMLVDPGLEVEGSKGHGDSSGGLADWIPRFREGDNGR